MRSVRTEPLVVTSFQLDFKMVGNVGEQNLNVVTKGTDIPINAATCGAVHGQIKYGLGMHGHLEEGYSGGMILITQEVFSCFTLLDIKIQHRIA